jgi:ribosome-associated translation inhibitor RaiA
MQNSLRLTFRSMAHSDTLAAHVTSRAAKLEHGCDRLVSCHVVLQLEGHHHRHGDRYRVCINLGLPKHEIIVSHTNDREPETPYASVDRAFDEAGRQLEGWIGRHVEHRGADARSR